ncbi:MAG: hypothetical protein J6X58_02045 [Bacteroidales bacterium]|nr:hypothetical protein [Bacteroidales bacterium]
MKIKSVLLFLIAVSFVVGVYGYPSKGKVLHYQFTEHRINFEGRTKAGDRGVMHCYDLNSGRMWNIGNPWNNKYSDEKGMPLDSNYIFDFDISTKALGPKQTYIFTFRCQRLDEAEGPFWFCNHKQAATKGYYPFRTEADHAIILKGKSSPDDNNVLCQWYREWGTPDTYCTVIMLVDRNDGKHTVYISDTGFYYYIDEAKDAELDRLVLRRLAKGGIQSVVIYNRHLAVDELEQMLWGNYHKSHLSDPVPIVNQAEKGEFEKKYGLRGWTESYLFQTYLCLGLVALTIIFNLFFRRGPYAYRGKGWVLLVMLISFVVWQLMLKQPFGGIHVMEITCFVSYILVSVGPVGEGYEKKSSDSFIVALLVALGMVGAYASSFLGSMLMALASGPLFKSGKDVVMRDGKIVYIGENESVTPVLGGAIATLIVYAVIIFTIVWTMSSIVISGSFLFVCIRFLRNFSRG